MVLRVEQKPRRLDVHEFSATKGRARRENIGGVGERKDRNRKRGGRWDRVNEESWSPTRKGEGKKVKGKGELNKGGREKQENVLVRGGKERKNKRSRKRQEDERREEKKMGGGEKKKTPKKH